MFMDLHHRADPGFRMAGAEQPRRPLLDGALPLAALLTLALSLAPLHGAAYALAALYLFFGAGMAPSGADRPGEPLLAWRAYGIACGLLALIVPVAALVPRLAPLEIVPVAVAAIGFGVHVHTKAALGVCRVGLLSALGRREHDARVGRTLEAMLLALTLGAIGHGPASAGLFAVAGWLLTAAATAERRGAPEATQGPRPRRRRRRPPQAGARMASRSAREDRPPASEPAPAA